MDGVYCGVNGSSYVTAQLFSSVICISRRDGTNWRPEPKVIILMVEM